MAEDCPCSWLDKAKAICLVLAALTAPIAAIFSGLNHNIAVETHQVSVENADKIGTVRHYQKIDQDANGPKIDAAEKAAVETKAVLEAAVK